MFVDKLKLLKLFEESLFLRVQGPAVSGRLSDQATDPKAKPPPPADRLGGAQRCAEGLVRVGKERPLALSCVMGKFQNHKPADPRRRPLQEVAMNPGGMAERRKMQVSP